MASATLLGLWLAVLPSIEARSPTRVAPSASIRITFEAWCDTVFPVAVVVERSSIGATVETKIREPDYFGVRQLLKGVALSKKAPLPLEVARQVEAAVRRLLQGPRRPRGVGTSEAPIRVSMLVGKDTVKGAASPECEDYGCIALYRRLIDDEFMRNVIETFYRRWDDKHTRPRSK